MLQRLMLLAVMATAVPKESAVMGIEDEEEDKLTQRRDEDEYIDVDEMRNQIHIDFDVDRARRGTLESSLGPLHR